MIPFRDVIPSRIAPIVTVGLIALHSAIFLLVPAQFSWQGPIPWFLLHDGWIHLISNLWALWLFGDNIESRLGHWRYLLLYVLTAASAAVVQVWAAPGSWPPVVGQGGGPGGAIAGIIGGYMLLYPGSRILVIVPRFFSIDVVEVPAVAFAGIWFATQLLLTLGRLGDPATGGGVLFLAYGGGFAAGMGLVWLFKQGQRDKRWWDQSDR
jgi:membrane associated rhomboid family serine protease